jgi:hypothetical protein
MVALVGRPNEKNAKKCKKNAYNSDPQKMQKYKYKNIQQQVFAGGHPPNY